MASKQPDDWAAKTKAARERGHVPQTKYAREELERAQQSAPGEHSAPLDVPPSVDGAAAPGAEPRPTNPRAILQADQELTDEVLRLYREALPAILKQTKDMSKACPRCKAMVHMKAPDVRAINDAMRLFMDQVAGRPKEAPVKDDATGIDLKALRHLSADERNKVRARLEAELAKL